MSRLNELERLAHDEIINQFYDHGGDLRDYLSDEDAAEYERLLEHRDTP